MIITTFATANVTGATTVLTHSANFTAGSDVLVALTCFNDLIPTAVDVNGTTAALDKGDFATQIWRAVGVAGGGATVTVTNPGTSGTSLTGVIQEFDGGTLGTLQASRSIWLGQTTPRETASVDVAGSPLIGDLVVAVVGRQSTIESGYTTSFDQAQDVGYAPGTGVYKLATVDGDQYITFNNVSSDFTSAVLTVYRAAPAGNDPLIAVAGSYGVTGQSAALLASHKIASAVGAYALTGSPAALSAMRALDADAGSYALSGAAAGLLYSQLVGMLSGAYMLTGNAVALKRNSTFPADSGVYGLSGNSATLTKIAAGVFVTGAYTLTGIAAELRKINILIAQTGSYSLIGRAATLRMLEDFVRSIERTYVVTAEDRVYSVDAEDRSYIVASEDRFNIVEGL